MGKGKLFIRFRNINVLLFALAFCVMAGVMLIAFNGDIRSLSSEYAERYAVSSAEALSAHISKELGLMAKAARSGSVTEWLLDEDDDIKKARAYAEMAGIVGELYSFNLYVGLQGSLHEYTVERDHDAADFRPFAVLDRADPADAWYFTCVEADEDYVLSVGIDRVLQRKRLWIDYKAVCDGAVLGVICTGLEFSHIAGELFSKYDSNPMRGLVIDRNGMICMDSLLTDGGEYLYQEFGAPVQEAFTDPACLAAVNAHLSGVKGHAAEIGAPAVVAPETGPYRYMTITPIRGTDWSVIILSGTPPLFGWSLFMPVLATVLILLVAFALSASAANYRLIFSPLHKLDHSLAQLRESHDVRVYGTEREDELGDLSKTIQDLFTKANVDALTKIYNRRFMENNLQHIMELLSRSNGLLSVLMLDVDHFKKYNDAYGHDQGDVCLTKVAGALAGSVTRTGDFTARYGGEEFVAVLPGTDEAGARLIAEKLLESVRALAITHEGNSAAPYVTVSAGAATGTVSYAQSWEEYIKRADEALYMSKENGRDRYTYLPLPGRTV